jgi:DNA-binding response OmpR family regulator
MTASATILIVDDDELLARRLAQHLGRLGYQVDVVNNADEARRATARHAPAVVVLDWNLPDSDGLHLLAEWRNAGSGVPVLMLSANVSTAHRINGLRAGADDYLVKPFDVSELLARLEALLRRSAPTSGPQGQVLCFGPYRLDVVAARVELAGEPLTLAAGELALLLAFARHAGQVLSRERLLEMIGDPFGERLSRSVDLRVARLRARLGDDADAARWIVTVRGQGYRFDARVENLSPTSSGAP